jgi:hypothetical protein
MDQRVIKCVKLNCSKLLMLSPVANMEAHIFCHELAKSISALDVVI